jgi:hypothetical protein
LIGKKNRSNKNEFKHCPPGQGESVGGLRKYLTQKKRTDYSTLLLTLYIGFLDFGF